ncbi:MAG TPA: macro domain-containing protein [Gemmatimonadales bacterium]|nr:macro domain-containing protein [Gemmatimonadales bacterium]
MIDVVVDDLALVQADAIVRPADELLEPLTPAMAALDRQAGDRFAAQRRVSAPLAAGAAVVTAAGDLATPLVLHVVIRDRSAEPGPDVVRRALVSAWQRAADWGLASIAAPLVGAGAGQLGPEAAAELLVETFPPAGPAPGRLRIVVDREEERALVSAIVDRRRA